jgi:hypothetical protein
MGKLMVISAKITEEVFKELVLRVPEGERSNFIRDAIMEKLQKTPRPDKILELEQRVGGLESSMAEVKRYLADLEILTYERGKINPHAFCIDDLDHKIVDNLIQRKGATTPELAETLGVNRWLILNRLKRLQRRSKKQLGKPIVKYYSEEKFGKRKAWWMSEEFL